VPDHGVVPIQRAGELLRARDRILQHISSSYTTRRSEKCRGETKEACPVHRKMYLANKRGVTVERLAEALGLSVESVQRAWKQHACVWSIKSTCSEPDAEGAIPAWMGTMPGGVLDSARMVGSTGTAWKIAHRRRTWFRSVWSTASLLLLIDGRGRLVLRIRVFAGDSQVVAVR
jgi:hypothetical protein